MSEPPQNQTKDDKELLSLLTKLYTIQEQVGAKPKSTDLDKINRAASNATMGRGKKAQKAGSRFVNLKSSIVDRLKSIHGLLEEEQNRVRSNFNVMDGNNPKEIIARQARIREEIRQAGDDWAELDNIYKNEARKRKSKFTMEELDVQQTLVQRLYAELEKVKELSKKNYTTRPDTANAKANGRDDLALSLNTQSLNVIGLGSGFDNGGLTQGDGFLGGGRGGGGGGEVELTHQQSLQMQQIESRDQEFDKQLEEIGEGIQDLSEIAQMQNEEVRRQNLMLENVGNKIDGANEHLSNINTKMKETLNEVRGADKICVDIMCIVMMVGLGAVLYQLIKTNGF
jgi:SYP7 family syntaxin